MQKFRNPTHVNIDKFFISCHGFCFVYCFASHNNVKYDFKHHLVKNNISMLMIFVLIFFTNTNYNNTLCKVKF